MGDQEGERLNVTAAFLILLLIASSCLTSEGQGSLLQLLNCRYVLNIAGVLFIIQRSALTDVFNFNTVVCRMFTILKV